jgi:hypothetical protein
MANPMAVLSTPSLDNQNVIVARSKVKGKPLEIPNKNAIKGIGRR